MIACNISSYVHYVVVLSIYYSVVLEAYYIYSTAKELSSDALGLVGCERLPVARASIYKYDTIQQP